MAERLIVLDVDGVLCNLYQGKIDLDMSWEDQGHLGDLATKFWASLPPYDWYLDLYNRLKAIAPVLIATALNPKYYAAYAGRAQWIQEKLNTTNFLIGPPKNYLAMPGRVLVDDSRETCAGFRKRGGQAIDFPRAWHGEPFDLETVIAQVRGLL